ncbi:hypothetical protein CEXT_172121, partial [Caerostris extrusa]
MNAVDFEFVPPPEAPVFEPTTEEFKDPLAYIAKIRPIAEQTGICKIKPPSEWQPPFAVDVDNFRFTPRMQRLNELEATTRVKLNFLDQIAKFWELQVTVSIKMLCIFLRGSSLKIPNVERKALDLFTLHRVVQEEGGSEIVSRERRWSRIATRMGFPPGRGVGSLLRQHYERILYPYHVFQEGSSIGEIQLNDDSDDSSQQDKDYIPHGIPSRQAIKPPADRYARRSKRCKEMDDKLNGIDYSTNNELKKLQFYGAGPKMPGYNIHGGIEELEEDSKLALKEQVIEDIKVLQAARDQKGGLVAKVPESILKETKTAEELEAVKLGVLLKMKDRPRRKMPIDQIVCNICGRGDEEASMLLCDGCDDSYHTFCLIPPLNEIPKGDWRCPCCVAKAINKPQEAFGFEQAQREYTLQEFGQKADEFKTSYFNMPAHRVPYSHVEKEFWRIVNAVEEDVTVEYGADLHTIEHGSGFPNEKTKALIPGDEEYVTSGWNLNNLPVLEGSVLKHIQADISGMKIPWTYVGMCFATFCWHNEDHWSYSINYLHWGEPKTWYGVPGGKAESFEEAMRSVAPELFNAQPDLLHQLVTIMNPNLLISQGVPIYRTNQQAGEFVITFPRSYHAGFNQGYNFAEAVNFAPADWLPIGRVCVSHYGMLHRFCVFSHDELVCKMATDPECLDISIAASTYQDMVRMVEAERATRKILLEWGVTSADREVFELLPDDERQCSYCKTTCFLSAVTCSCNDSQLVCIAHRDKLCSCPPEEHTLLYRYTLDELPVMLNRLKVRAESFDSWSSEVQDALSGHTKKSISELRDYLTEAEEKKFPSTELLKDLADTIDEGEKCTAIAQQLLSTRIRTRARQVNEVNQTPRLTLEDLHVFHQQLSTVPCEIKELIPVKELLDRCVAFQVEAQEILDDEKVTDPRQLEKILLTGTNLDIEIPEMIPLKYKLDQCLWLEEVRGILMYPDRVTLEVLRGLLEKGITLPVYPTVEKVMAELQELLTFGEKWEEKAKSYLQTKQTLTTVESTVRDASNISVHLPHVVQLTDAVRKAKDWLQRLQQIQNEAHNPYLEVLEQLLVKGRPIPVRLDQLTQIELQVEAARSWKEKTSRTFQKKNSGYTLLEVLSPRKDIGSAAVPKSKRKRKDFDDDDASNDKFDEVKDPATIVANFKEAERRELEAMTQLRARNEQKCNEERTESRFCICHKPYSNGMVQCELCKDSFHVQCLPSQQSVRKSQGGGRFLCGWCLRSRRPRLDSILTLLLSLQKLPMRLAEGEALQCLTERGMAWQDRAKQVLKTDELSSALTALSVITQQKTELTFTEKSEQIVHAELQKASNTTESKPEDLLQRWRNLIPSEKCEGKEFQVPDIPPKKDEIEMVDLTGDPPHTDTEHAYSSASKTSTIGASPRKHSRKSPLVARQMESPTMVQLSENMRTQLEQLLMEGDLLEMTLDETQDIWRLLQATRPDFVPFPELEETTPKVERKRFKKMKMDDSKSNIAKSK